MIRPLRLDSDFLALAKVAGSAAFARACDTGTYTTPTPRVFPEGPGWGFSVTSERRNTWIVKIVVNEKGRRYQVSVEPEKQ